LVKALSPERVRKKTPCRSQDAEPGKEKWAQRGGKKKGGGEGGQRGGGEKITTKKREARRMLAKKKGRTVYG